MLLAAIVLLNLLQALLLMVLNHLLTVIILHLSLMGISDRVMPGTSPVPASESRQLTTLTILTIPMTMLPTPMTMAMPVMPAIQMLVHDIAQT